MKNYQLSIFSIFSTKLRPLVLIVILIISGTQVIYAADPAITNVSVQVNSTYKVGATIGFTVEYDQNVDVTGTPRIPLTVGSDTRYAAYIDGSGGTALSFKYTVLDGDLDMDGISILGNVLDLNSGTIKKAGALDNAVLTLSTHPVLTGIKVDGVVPTLTSVSIASNNSVTSLAKTGDWIIVSFTASEQIRSPTVRIMGKTPAVSSTGGNNWQAEYILDGTEGAGAVTFTIDFDDLSAGNAGTRVTSTTNGSSVTINSTDASLSALVLSNGILTPAFNSGTLAYTAVVASTVSSITVTPITSNANATIKVNNLVVASGSASASLPLAQGTNVITTIVTAQDGTTTKTYTLTVTRPVSTNANLINLVVNHATGPISPAFSSGISNYTVSVPSTTVNTTIQAVVEEAGTTLKLNGATITSGVASDRIPLNVGANVISVVATAADGVTTKTYSVTVTRAVSTNAELSNLVLNHIGGALSPAFSSGISNYTVSVPSTTVNTTVQAVVAEAGTTLKLNGVTLASNVASERIPLNVGANVISVVATAADGVTTKTYSVTVTRAISTNAELANLVLNHVGPLSPAFNRAVTNYTASVSSSTTSTTMQAVIAEAGATLKLNGVTIANQVTTAPIPLNVGPNTISVVATAPDGVTTKTYTVVVTRAAPVGWNVATLSALTANAGLPISFVSTTTNYNLSVQWATKTIIIIPVRTNNLSTVKVNGTTVGINVPQSIPLETGDNKILIEVTAQDGVTKSTYTLTVKRAEKIISDVATLTGLTYAPNGELSVSVPNFTPNGGASSYAATISRVTTFVNISANSSNQGIGLKLNGVSIDPDASNRVDIARDTTVLTFVTLSTDGTKSKTYTLTLTKEGSSADLATIATSFESTFNPAFNRAHTTYSGTIPNSSTIASFQFRPFESTATIKVNGANYVNGVTYSTPVSVGVNKVEVLVTNTTGLTKTYTFNVTRAPVPVADLSSLISSTGRITPTFNTFVTSYTATVINDSISVRITPRVSPPGASVKVNGVTVASGASSPPIALSDTKVNEILTVVTSADGLTSRTYTLRITRAPKDGIVLSAGGEVTISPAASKVVVGSPTQAVTVNIPPPPANPDASYKPGVDFRSLMTVAGEVTIPQTTINSTIANVAIPGSTKVISSDPNWDGVIQAPLITSYSVPTPVGMVAQTGLVISVGSPGIALSFDKAVRLLLPGQAGKKAAMVHGTTYREITTVGTEDSQAAGDALPAEGAFTMNVGADLVVWTKAFSTFMTYSQSVDLNVAVVAADMGSLTADLIKGGNTDLDHIITALADPLPAVLSGGSTVSYASSDAAIIAADGKTVKRPVFGTPPPVVTLTATVTKGLIVNKKAFNLTVTPLPNQAPTLDAIANQTICFTSAAQRITLTGISAGPENGQTTHMAVSSGNASLLSGLAVDNASGVISYTPANAAGGVTTVTVVIKDNAGTADGGVDTLVRTFTITVNPVPNVQIFNNLGTTELSKGLTLTLTASGGSTYSWANAHGIISGQNSAALTIRPSVSTSYTVTVTNASGCVSTHSIAINVVEDYKALDINNLMSPNGDGVNDVLMIKNLDMYPNHTVKIFDRSGRMLFQQQNYTNDWDGTFQGSRLAEGTYFYVVDFEKGKKVLRGFVSIVN